MSGGSIGAEIHPEDRSASRLLDRASSGASLIKRAQRGRMLPLVLGRLTHCATNRDRLRVDMPGRTSDRKRAEDRLRAKIALGGK
jgi:hypothetical protein